MREVFSIKAFREAFIQAGIISKAQYFGNKIDNRIIDFIIRMGQGKKAVDQLRHCVGDNYEKSNGFA
jgi:hypothetical protein